ncbi:protein translocase subunit SecF [Moraxella atlantae]|uniref:Protein-export membrane protein SecF n=1 Tax=Faucicola atlantae TaxID=34059 RepID=A0A1B8QAR8_9GAMM|nr:protein translocase subunit SecF [Moraxella atlantae]OBX76431.1 protein-export membrane protein SecF [Moraxella atlantae]
MSDNHNQSNRDDDALDDALTPNTNAQDAQQRLADLGVQSLTAGDTSRRQRRAPRRSGRGGNHATKSRQDTPTNTPTTDAVQDTSTNAADQNHEGLIATPTAVGDEKTLTGKRVINFMKVTKPFAVLSLILTLVGLGAILVKGLNLGLDFTGGVSATVVYAQPVQQAQVQQALASHQINDGVVQYLGSNKEILLRLPPQNQVEGLSQTLDQALDLPNNDATIKSIDVVGSQVGNEIYVNSIMALALALACMFIYVAVRFEWKLALGAVLALFHDSIITVGIFALFGWPFDLTVLAAILSLVGYSINDTIVVFDRIRENFRRVRDVDATTIVNLSLTETLRRTIMTISTVLLVVLAMIFLGGASLYWFAIALFIGLILGTFSSVYIASAIPLWMGMSRKDFIVEVKPEFIEEEVVFDDRHAPVWQADESDDVLPSDNRR